jgi:hypothetical protein
MSSIGEQYFLVRDYPSFPELDTLLTESIDRAFQKLTDWQNQSPGTSFSLNIYEQFSRLQESEFLFFLALGFLTKRAEVRTHCILILESGRTKQTPIGILVLKNNLEEMAKHPQRLHSHYLETEVFPWFALRRMKGLLSDPALRTKFRSRLKRIRPKKPPKVLRTERIRGYRDHGHLPSTSERAIRRANEDGQTLRKIEEFLLQEYLQNLKSQYIFIRANAFSFYQKELQKVRNKYGQSL